MLAAPAALAAATVAFAIAGWLLQRGLRLVGHRTA
jgi:hypothetical protein